MGSERRVSPVEDNELIFRRQSKQFSDFYAAFEQGQMERICYEPSQSKGLNASPLRVRSSI